MKKKIVHVLSVSIFGCTLSSGKKHTSSGEVSNERESAKKKQEIFHGRTFSLNELQMRDIWVVQSLNVQ